MSAAAPAPSGSPQRLRLTLTPAAVIVLCCIGLTVLGLIMLFSAGTAFKEGPYYYFNKQLIGVVLTMALCWVVSRLDLENLRRFAWIVGGLSLFSLVAVLIPHIGITVKGSRRWLGFGPLRIQVSEFAKIAMVFCLAHYLALNQTRIHELRRGFVYPLAMICGFAGLILLEPDFGTAALAVAVGLVMLFLAGARWRYILPTIAGVSLVFTLAVLHNPNRLRRFTAFLDVQGNRQGGTYQLYQALAAFASGGVDGVGLGQGRQQHKFLPEAQTDFIFAVVGEELGLYFTVGVVALFSIIFVAGLMHLRKAPNQFQFQIVLGSLLMLCLQAIINLGVVTGIFPTKGMSLPFLSAGLSNLLLMGIFVGVFLSTQRTWGRAKLAGPVRSIRELLS
ncbi:lipid II flippase FtsW [mine drainage metagenome]|uniref:peptidoglycan glycosyltransferase n=1 Tax=mine drainage metagenome TaxID=410659 RepID=A0A1J5TQH3_9ZZZZ